jgi:hypothetical protein
MLKSHDRFPYSPIIKRPNFTWPNGKRLAVHVCLNLEHFSYGEGLGISYSPRIPHPNTYNWGWREYGNGVGVWRLIELFDHLHLPVSLAATKKNPGPCANMTFNERTAVGRLRGPVERRKPSGHSETAQSTCCDRRKASIWSGQEIPSGGFWPASRPRPEATRVRQADYQGNRLPCWCR